MFNLEVSENLEDDSISWMEFGLADEILKALRDLNFTEPTTIQKLCILPAIRDGLDILGAAETVETVENYVLISLIVDIFC